MSTETQKRKQTLSILDKLRTDGMPGGQSRYTNEWTGEELPPEEEGDQQDFDAQQKARREQELLNRADMSEPTAAAYGAVGTGMRPGPTGMTPAGAAGPAGTGPAGMTPYSPEEFERRRGFSERPMPASKRSRKKSEEETAEDDQADKSAPVVGGY